MCNESNENQEASGPSEVAIKIFKAGGDKFLKFLINIFNDILFKDKDDFNSARLD